MFSFYSSYLYLSDFLFSPSDRGINPFALRCDLSVKPALPALYRFIASAVSGAFSLNCLKVFMVSIHLLYYFLLSFLFRFFFNNLIKDFRKNFFLFFYDWCFIFNRLIVNSTICTVFNSCLCHLFPHL